MKLESQNLFVCSNHFYNIKNHLKDFHSIIIYIFLFLIIFINFLIFIIYNLNLIFLIV